MRLRKRHTGVIVFGLIVAVLAIATALVLLWQPPWLFRNTLPVADETRRVVAPRPVSVSSNTLFFGNAYWGRYINDWSMASELKTAYPFSRLNEFHREKYDAWIAGLECPTVAGLHLTSAQEDETLSFNCNPDYLPEAAKWFTAFTLANNHTDNQGLAGFAETKQHLEENHIQYFGHYDPEQTGDVCEVVALPVTVTYDDDSTKQQHLPIALCGYHAVFQLPSEESLDQIAQYAAIMPVIAMPHMGAEYKAAPDELKTSYYRAMIDQGADMVLGDHPHWIQTTEAYKDKLIVYSMGNFMFDQQDTTEVTRSAAINVLMKTSVSQTPQLEQWLALGEKCATFHDTCASDASAQQLSKLSLTYTYDAIGTNDANKIVKPATPDQQAQILSRLQWSQTMSKLQPTP